MYVSNNADRVCKSQTHNTTPAINGDAFTSVSQVSSSHTPVHRTPLGPSGPPIHRPGRPSALGLASVSPIHSRRDPFSVDYGLWPFDDKDYNIVCTVTNLAVNTDLSLWTPLLTEEARRQACTQYRGRCCNCGSTDHSLRWCPAPFKNVFPLFNPDFATHDPGGSTLETWERRMRNWRRKGSQRRYQGFLRRFFRASAPRLSLSPGFYLGSRLGSSDVVGAALSPRLDFSIADSFAY